jgi:hypothetical protein
MAGFMPGDLKAMARINIPFCPHIFATKRDDVFDTDTMN